MGLKIDNLPIDAWLSKMEATIENIVSFTAVDNLAVNHLMEREATMAVIANVVSAKKPKWTTVMAKNVCKVVRRAMETLANMPK